MVRLDMGWKGILELLCRKRFQRECAVWDGGISGDTRDALNWILLGGNSREKIWKRML